MTLHVTNAKCSWGKRGPASASFTVPVENAYLQPPPGLRERAWVEIGDAHTIWDGEIVSIRPSISESGEHSLAVECSGMSEIAARRADLRKVWTHRGSGGWTTRPGYNQYAGITFDQDAVCLLAAKGETIGYTGTNSLYALFALSGGLSDDESSYITYTATWDVLTEGGSTWTWLLYAGPSMAGPFTVFDSQANTSGTDVSASGTPPAGTRALVAKLQEGTTHTITADKFVKFSALDIYASGRTTKVRLDEAFVDVMTQPGLAVSCTSERIGDTQDHLEVGTASDPVSVAGACETLESLHSQPVDWGYGLGRTAHVRPYLWTPDNPAKIIVVGGGNPGLVSWEVAEYDEDVPQYAEVVYGNKDNASYPEGWPRKVYRPSVPPNDNAHVTSLNFSQYILSDAAANAIGDNLVGHAPAEIAPDYCFRIHGDRVRQGLWPGKNTDLLQRASVQDIGPSRAVGTLTGVAYTSASGYSGSGSPADPSCIVLDGTGDYVTFGDLAALDLGTGARTITAWVKVDAIGDQQAIFAKELNSGTYIGYELCVQTDGTLRAQLIQDVGATQYRRGVCATVISADTWYHVAAVYAGSGGDWSIYLDGAAETMTHSGAAGAWNSDNAVVAAIGVRDPLGTPGYSLGGRVNAVTIYSRALSAAEVAQDYNAGMVIYDRSFSKGTVAIQGAVVNQLGARILAPYVTTDGWWVQNLSSGTNRPLRITATSVDMTSCGNALTIGEDWMEQEIGARMAEFMAWPETEEETDATDPDPWQWWR